MAYLVLPEQEQKQSVMQTVHEKKENIIRRATDISMSFGNFLIMYTAVFMYYLFAGISVVVRGRVPKGWNKPTKEYVDYMIHNLDDFKLERKEQKKYGRVYDLDYQPPGINLMK